MLKITVRSVLLSLMTLACGTQSDSALKYDAHMAAFAEASLANIQKSSESERKSFVDRFRSLDVDAFYDLLLTSAPRGDVSINGRLVNDFASRISTKKSMFQRYAVGYRTVGDLLDGEGLPLSFPKSTDAIRQGFADLYDGLLITEPLALEKPWPEDEKVNECQTALMLQEKTYECYGEFKVTRNRQIHIDKHLGPSTYKKAKHTIFTNPGVIASLYDILRTGSKPVQGPLAQEGENAGKFASWYKINNAGTGGEQYVVLITRENGVVVTSFPVSNLNVKL